MASGAQGGSPHRLRECPRGSPYEHFARIYDQVMGDAVFPLIRRSFSWAVQTYRLPFASAADVGCGTGTFLNYLAAFASPVYGVDASPAMLRVAAGKLRHRHARLLCQDLAALRLPRPVDLITCNFDTLNYLLSAARFAAALARVHANLTAGGHFLFDLISGGHSPRERETAVQRIRLPGVSARWRITMWPQRRASLVKMHFVFRRAPAGCNRVQESHWQRWYPWPWVCQLLRDTGFAVRGVHDAETLRPAAAETCWVKFIARRLSSASRPGPGPRGDD